MRARTMMVVAMASLLFALEVGRAEAEPWAGERGMYVFHLGGKDPYGVPGWSLIQWKNYIDIEVQYFADK